MYDANEVQSLMVEFNRFEGEAVGIAKGRQYIRTIGLDGPSQCVPIEIGNEEFQRLMWRLRKAAAQAQVTDALEKLSAVPAKLLEKLPAQGQQVLQLDFVSNAPELWAVPFEAWREGGLPVFANRERPVVLTRRVRGGFSGLEIEWPAKPRVLFVHAAIAGDLSKELVEEHVEALRRALAPHVRKKATCEDLLTVKQVFSVADLVNARRAGEFTHIHVLAHGQAIQDPELPTKIWWGLRLGPSAGDAAPPVELAEALGPDEGLPVVVTLAACDSGNQADTNLPTASLVHELHSRGVPVVVGSQLPLTKYGSSRLAERFYTRLLQGDDVRLALHDARAVLYEHRAELYEDAETSAGCDWVALVGYVRLPANYGVHLMRVALQTELAMLDAVQAATDDLNRDGGTVADYRVQEQRLRERIVALQGRMKELRDAGGGIPQECEGLLASAHKRLAELLFSLARLDPPSAGDSREASRDALEQALRHYDEAFRSGLEAHWQGIQQLGLQAALRGTVDPDDWMAVEYAARKARRDPQEIWAFGTLAEAYLLAQLAERGDRMKDAREAVGELKRRAEAAKKSFPIESTRRQLNRYMEWWTSGNGFFPEKTDVAKDALELAGLLG